MKKFFESKQFKILLIILAVLVGLMVAGVYNEGYASFMSNVSGIITTPFQKASASISNTVNGWLQKYTDYDAMFNENQELKTELQEMREKMADYDTIKYENQQFHSIIGTIEEHDDWVIQPATVISRDTFSKFYSFKIDKGSSSGIKYLDPVMSSDGLVGYVIEVGTNHAKVATILDFQVDVGVYESESREIAVLSGDEAYFEEGYSVINYLNRNTAVAEGNSIYTSGNLEGGLSLYPRGIYVGKVVKVQPDEHGTGMVAIVEPGANISEVKDVFVITDFKGREE